MLLHEMDGYCYSFIVKKREREELVALPPISASELGWVSSLCTYGLISCRRNMSVKAGMPRARLALEVARSRKIRIMWASSFQAWVASSWQQWMRWAWLSGPSVSPLSPGRPHVLVGCSEGVRCPDLCYPRIAASDFLIWGGRGPSGTQGLIIKSLATRFEFLLPAGWFDLATEILSVFPSHHLQNEDCSEQ